MNPVFNTSLLPYLVATQYNFSLCHSEQREESVPRATDSSLRSEWQKDLALRDVLQEARIHELSRVGRLGRRDRLAERVAHGLEALHGGLQRQLEGRLVVVQVVGLAQDVLVLLLGVLLQHLDPQVALLVVGHHPVAQRQQGARQRWRELVQT